MLFLRLEVLVLIFTSISIANGYLEWEPRNYALDLNLFENSIDPERCREQMIYIMDNTRLMTTFLDAGIRTPRGILTGNLVDLGNYYQCLDINEDTGTSYIQGKYCAISVPLSQEELQLPSWPSLPDEWPDFPWGELFPNTTRLSSDVMAGIRNIRMMKSAVQVLSGSQDDYTSRVSSDSAFSSMSLTLSVCVPKSCSTRQALDSLFFNTTSAGLQYTEQYCRLPNDKPWVPADYVATAVFGFLGLLTILSTIYDVRYSVLQRKEPTSVNRLYQSFSVYNNCRRLVTFTSNPKTIECLDGLRVLAMMWVIVGHTFSTQVQGHLANPLDSLAWLESLHSIWITAAPITVDTFFLLSGILVVYTTAGKMRRRQLVNNVHLFYLQRLLRMFPVLAAAVLLQASWFNHMADGPYWQPLMRKVHKCRMYWWSTLLHIQNYVNPGEICLGHTWYLAVDIQLHILSPLILFWVLSGKRFAWVALTAGLMISLASATVFNVVQKFPSAVVKIGTIGNNAHYMQHYYVNTLTRASPFFVGMIYGYLLFVGSKDRFQFGKGFLSIAWTSWLLITGAVLYITYPIQQENWDHKNINILINSYMRPLWAHAVGWMIFACQQGYGGPINWLLSFRMWKVPARLSYAMYIFHYPIIIAMNSTTLVPVYFSESAFIFRFFADFSMALFVAFLVTLLIDSPFSTLIGLALRGGKRSQKHTEAPQEIMNGIENPAFTHEIKTKL